MFWGRPGGRRRAYEYLVDPDNLVTYESARPFDDSIPSADDVLSGGFFEILDPAFARNAKWSQSKPVPLLGRISASPEYVQEFYRFWFNFDSWRDVSTAYQEQHGDWLHDLSRASGRQDRRQMQIDNEKLRRRFKAAEVRRIQSLAQLSRKLDPRLQLQTGENPSAEVFTTAGDSRQDDSQEPLSSAMQAALELEQQALERRKVDELAVRRRDERIQQEAARQNLRNRRAQLRTVVQEHELRVDKQQLQEFIVQLDLVELEELTAQIKDVMLSPQEQEDLQILHMASAGVQGQANRPAPQRV